MTHTHMHSHTLPRTARTPGDNYHVCFQTLTSKKNSRESKALKLLLFHHNLLLSVPQIQLSLTQVLSAEKLVF